MIFCKVKAILILIIFFLIYFTTPLYAKPYQRFYTGVRPMGMGGAFTAVSDDRNTIFYNPAGLSRIDGLTLGILNPAAGLGENTLDFYSDEDDADLDNKSEVDELLKKYSGDHLHFYASLAPHLGFRINNFGVMVSAFGIASSDSYVEESASPRFHFNSRLDIGGIGGVGFMFPGIKGMRAGLALKTISRESINEVYTSKEIADNDFDDLKDDDKSTDTGTGLDIGIIYTLPWDKFVQTDIAVTGQNIEEIEFDNGDKLATEWTLGFAFRKKLGPFSFLAAFDYRDFTNNLEEDDDFEKRIHMGTEIKFKNLIALRGGMNQGYPTLGASLDLWVLKLDAAMYSEETGESAGDEEDKRIMAQVTIGW
jgi:hypothetical protein